MKIYSIFIIFTVIYVAVIADESTSADQVSENIDYEESSVEDRDNNEPKSEDQDNKEPTLNTSYESIEYDHEDPLNDEDEDGIRLAGKNGCMPPPGPPPGPPPDDEYPDPELLRRGRQRSRSQRVKTRKAQQKTAPLIRPTPDCKDYNIKLSKEMKAMSPDCKTASNKNDCQYKKMKIAAKKVGGPNEDCITQVKTFFGT